jgi:hypothetical protein
MQAVPASGAMQPVPLLDITVSEPGGSQRAGPRPVTAIAGRGRDQRARGGRAAARAVEQGRAARAHSAGRAGRGRGAHHRPGHVPRGLHAAAHAHTDVARRAPAEGRRPLRPKRAAAGRQVRQLAAHVHFSGATSRAPHSAVQARVFAALEGDLRRAREVEEKLPLLEELTLLCASSRVAKKLFFEARARNTAAALGRAGPSRSAQSTTVLPNVVNDVHSCIEPVLPVLEGQPPPARPPARHLTRTQVADRRTWWRWTTREARSSVYPGPRALTRT